MKSLVCLVLATFFFTQFAWGIFESDIESIQKKIARRQTDIQAVQDKIAPIQKKIDHCSENFKDDTCGGFLENSGVKDLKATIVRLEKEKKSIVTDVSDLNKKVEALKAKETDAKAAIDREKTVKAQAKVQDLRLGLSEDALKMLELKFDVNDLGHKIDKMALGQYVAAKMGLALNSRAFCQSIKRCGEPEGQANNKVTPEQMREIFPGLGDIFTQQKVDFWQRANQNRNPAPAPASGRLPGTQ